MADLLPTKADYVRALVASGMSRAHAYRAAAGRDFAPRDFAPRRFKRASIGRPLAPLAAAAPKHEQVVDVASSTDANLDLEVTDLAMAGLSSRGIARALVARAPSVGKIRRVVSRFLGVRETNTIPLDPESPEQIALRAASRSRCRANFLDAEHQALVAKLDDLPLGTPMPNALRLAAVRAEIAFLVADDKAQRAMLEAIEEAERHDLKIGDSDAAACALGPLKSAIEQGLAGGWLREFGVMRDSRGVNQRAILERLEHARAACARLTSRRAARGRALPLPIPHTANVYELLASFDAPVLTNEPRIRKLEAEAKRLEASSAARGARP